jgi:hypothetical protein
LLIKFEQFCGLGAPCPSSIGGGGSCAVAVAVVVAVAVSVNFDLRHFPVNGAANFYY